MISKSTQLTTLMSRGHSANLNEK